MQQLDDLSFLIKLDQLRLIKHLPHFLLKHSHFVFKVLLLVYDLVNIVLLLDSLVQTSLNRLIWPDLDIVIVDYFDIVMKGPSGVLASIPAIVVELNFFLLVLLLELFRHADRIVFLEFFLNHIAGDGLVVGNESLDVLLGSDLLGKLEHMFTLNRCFRTERLKHA
jgi:hypothetical protein